MYFEIPERNLSFGPLEISPSYSNIRTKARFNKKHGKGMGQMLTQLPTLSV